MTKELKGCGKEFMWFKDFNDKRICGSIEDLKHSDHIILCPECKAKLEVYSEWEQREKEVLELINKEPVYPHYQSFKISAEAVSAFKRRVIQIIKGEK